MSDNTKPKIKIEYSAYVRKYFVFDGGRALFITTRKDQALKYAKKNFGIRPEDITVHNRNVKRDLIKFSIMDEEAATRWIREH